jgi:hypothetical protein
MTSRTCCFASEQNIERVSVSTQKEVTTLFLKKEIVRVNESTFRGSAHMHFLRVNHVDCQSQFLSHRIERRPIRRCQESTWTKTKSEEIPVSYMADELEPKKAVKKKKIEQYKIGKIWVWKRTCRR